MLSDRNEPLVDDQESLYEQLLLDGGWVFLVEEGDGNLVSFGARGFFCLVVLSLDRVPKVQAVINGLQV